MAIKLLQVESTPECGRGPAQPVPSAGALGGPGNEHPLLLAPAALGHNEELNGRGGEEARLGQTG